MRRVAEQSSDGKAHVENSAKDHRTARGKSMDKAKVGNDVIQDPLTADDLRRLWPGFLRVEVLDTRDGAPHQLTGGSKSVLDDYKWMKDVPPSMEYEQTNGTIDPNVCCGVPPGQAIIANKKWVSCM